MQKGKARRGEDAYPEEGESDGEQAQRGEDVYADDRDSDGDLEDFDTLDTLETADVYRDTYGAESDSSSDSE